MEMLYVSAAKKLSHWQTKSLDNHGLSNILRGAGFTLKRIIFISMVHGAIVVSMQSPFLSRGTRNHRYFKLRNRVLHRNCTARQCCLIRQHLSCAL